jgi:aryl-alcohol dehydrogenase-like predicted oxidoreductase
MQYRTFGGTGWGASAVGLGTWNIGNQWGAVDDETARRVVRSAIDAGVNFVDTAESYGQPNGTSELRVGRAIEGLREHLYLVSKVGHWGKRTGQAVPKTTPDMIRLCGHAIAGRLGVDGVDLLLCHEGDIEDPSTYVEGFERLVDEGYTREYGISTGDIDVLKRFYEASDGRCGAVEFNYSLIEREPEEDILPFCAEHDIGAIVRTPLARGLLAGKYDRDTEFTDDVRDSWNEGESDREEFLDRLAAVERVQAELQEEGLVETALQYVASHPVEPVVIPGATTPEQAVANAAAGDSLLSEGRREELAEL